MPQIIVPTKHLLLNKDDAKSPEAIEQLIRAFEPELPEKFINAVIIHIRDGVPPVTGVWANAGVKDTAEKLYNLLDSDFARTVTDGKIEVISVLLFYNKEQNILIGHIGILGSLLSAETPEGTFITNQIGRA